jgi:hypothetical protein
MSKCTVCEKHQNKGGLPGGFILSDDLLFLAHFPHSPDGPPAHFGHLILEFKRHITNPAELTDQEAQRMGLLVPKICRALEKVLGAEHVSLRLYLNDRRFLREEKEYGRRIQSYGRACKTLRRHGSISGSPINPSQQTENSPISRESRNDGYF